MRVYYLKLKRCMTILRQCKKKSLLLVMLGILCLIPIKSMAEEEKSSSLEAMARAAQDPLANIAAVNLESNFFFGQGLNEDQVGYNFQIQPVYSINTNWGFNVIYRGLIPIVGAPPLSDFPELGQQRPAGGGTTWGLSDIVNQFYFAPTGGDNFKWGLGPQFSLRTHTNSRVRGAGWGSGPVAVLLGNYGPWSFGSLISNLWSFDGQYNTMVIQPLFYLNINSVPGLSLSYSPAITADWKQPQDNRWTVPVGLGIGKTFALGEKYGIDVSLSGFYIPIRPVGGPNWQLKLGLFFILPH